MRILMLNYEFPPLGGGAGNASYYLLKEFAKYDGLEIDLITSSTQKYKEEIFSKNVTVYYLDIYKSRNISSQSMKDLLIYSWKAYFFSKKLINSKQYDLVHCFFGIPCGAIAYKLGLPYIVSLRGSDVPGHNPKFKYYYLILGWLIKKVWRGSKKLIANSDDLKKSALAFYNKKPVDVIANGVDTEKFSPCHKNDKLFRVLFVGRFHKIKGIEYLLNGFLAFAKGKTDVELVLAGDGAMLKYFSSMYASYSFIKFVGVKPQDILIDIYKSSDIFVLPSLNEGMSNSLLEAMACGLAIITTDTGGASILVNNDSGIIVEKKSSLDIADALNRLYSNTNVLNNMKKNNRNMALTFSWSDIADEYLAIYQSV